MENDITIDELVRLSFVDGVSASVYGRVVAVERNEDDSIHAILVRSLSAEGVGTLYFPTSGMTVEPVVRKIFN